AENHIGPYGAALVIGRRRQLPWLDKGADDAAFEQDGEAGATQPLGESRGQQWNSHAGKYQLSVAELAWAQHGQQLRRGMDLYLKHHRCLAPSGRARAARRCRSSRETRSTTWGRRRTVQDIAARP